MAVPCCCWVVAGACREDVDAINSQQLRALPSEAHKFVAQVCWEESIAWLLPHSDVAGWPGSMRPRLACRQHSLGSGPALAVAAPSTPACYPSGMWRRMWGHRMCWLPPAPPAAVWSSR